MTVVVTGASGHIGNNLVRELLARGERVRALVHHTTRPLDGLEIERIEGSVLAPETLRRAFRGADVVYHLASVISIQGDPDGRVWRTNVEGAGHVARAARECDVRRLVHMCSIHAFEAKPRHEVLDEQRPRATAPNRPAYDRSKASGEAAVREEIARGLDAVILHPSGVIGPFDFAPSRMGRFFLQLYHRKLAGLVRGSFDWVDVRDVVATTIAASARGRCGESYLVGGHPCSMRDLGELARQEASVRPPRMTYPMTVAGIGAPVVETYARLRHRDPIFTRESMRALRGPRVAHLKAQRELGHDPRPTRESVRDVYAWFESAGYLKESATARASQRPG